MINSKKPYHFNIARIKPFLLAQSRITTAKVAIKYIDDVIRICIDNVTFSQSHDDVVFQKHFKLSKELKTTGIIEFKYGTCYYNETTGYKTRHFDKSNDDSDDDSDDE